MKKGYCNGSDMLLFVGGKAVGHCTTHTASFQSETKDHAVKPEASVPMKDSLWKDKTVSGLSYTVKADGLVFYDEKENGFKALLKLWKTGEPVEIKCLERGSDTKPYLGGLCVIDSLERTDPAQDDSTYSISLSNAGAPTVFDESALTEGASPAA